MESFIKNSLTKDDIVDDFKKRMKCLNSSQFR